MAPLRVTGASLRAAPVTVPEGRLRTTGLPQRFAPRQPYAITR